MKRILFLIASVVFFFCGCGSDIDPNESEVDTQTRTAPIESASATYAIVNTTAICVTKGPTCSIEAGSSTVAPTETAQKTVIFGFVKQVLNNSVVVEQIDVVCHNAGETDKFGDEYQNSWLEVVHLDKEYTLKLADDATHIYADMFNKETDNDDPIVWCNITSQEFLKICTLEYYNNKLYFEFEVVDGNIMGSKLLLEYYLNG